MRRQKHSEVRPQGGQVNNYKALQRVAGEPAVLNPQSAEVTEKVLIQNKFTNTAKRYKIL